MGASGDRIHDQARSALAGLLQPACTLYRVRSMAEAVTCARQVTPPGGAVLLSPAAPSSGHYRDFTERGHDFAAKAGLASQ